MRIGYLIQNNAPDLSTLSGPQLHTLAVIKGLKKLGYEVRTIAIQNYELGWSDDLLGWQKPRYGWTQSRWFRWLESGVRRIQTELHLPFLGVFDSLHFADASTQLLKGYDVLYERNGYLGYGGVIAARWLGVPLVIELNGNIIEEIDEIGVKMSKFQRWLGRWITVRTWKAASHMVVVSEALKQQLIGFSIPESRISVVLNGVNVEVFSKSYDRNAVREQYKLGYGPLIAFVGSFQPWHGVDLLVSSFEQIQERYSDAKLLLIGDGAGRESVEKKITELELVDKVKLIGQLQQVQIAAILNSADVAVAPYPFTHADIVGTPLKLLEYMAAGKAIVASTAPIHEIISDGVTGIRVSPADVTALASGIDRLLGDTELRMTLGKNAQSQAIRKHSWDHTVEQLVEIFATQISLRMRRKLVTEN